MSLPTSAPRQRWRYLAFFGLLACLAVAGVTLPIVYNLGQQLKPEQLEQARARWRDNGPADYDLTYSVAYDRSRLAERHLVLVRGGKVAFASCEGEVVSLSPALSAMVGLPLGGTGEGRARDVPALFAHIEAMLKEEEAAGRRNFLVAVFDPREGYPRRFIRRVRGTKTREEWDVRLWEAGSLGTPGARAKQPEARR